MTNGDRIRSMDDNELAMYLLKLLKGDEGNDYEYRCGNCPAANCMNFEPEEMCCWGTMTQWLEAKE